MKIDDNELRLINNFSRKEFTENDVYAFPVVLCDNDIDRDNECFSNEALKKLSELFVGVSGIFDHNPSAKNQIARIYAAEVESVPGRTTAYGTAYKRLLARAYVPKTAKTKELIDMIDGGIIKEVSVGCRAGKRICSICGKSIDSSDCRHVKGRVYDGKKCYGILDEPTDAYEWSFIAVPAQRSAGVVKSYSFEAPVPVDSYICDLKKKADEAERYRGILRTETVKAGVTAKIGISGYLLERMVSALDMDELIELKSRFEKASANSFPGRRQTRGELSGFSGKNPDNSGYII